MPAYLDVLYDSDIVAVIDSQSNPLGFDIEFGPKYSNGGIADATTLGLIDEAGAFQSGFSPLGPAEFLLFRVGFEAGGFTAVDDTFDGIDEDSQDVVLDVLANDLGRSGVAVFSGDPADRSPGRDVSFFDPPGAVAGEVDGLRRNIHPRLGRGKPDHRPSRLADAGRKCTNFG